MPTIGERILGPILNQVKYPTTCMSITTFAFKWPNRTSQLCKRESVDKMGGVVTTEMGGICLNWALCLRFVHYRTIWWVDISIEFPQDISSILLITRQYSSFTAFISEV